MATVKYKIKKILRKGHCPSESPSRGNAPPTPLLLALLMTRTFGDRSRCRHAVPMAPWPQAPPSPSQTLIVAEIGKRIRDKGNGRKGQRVNRKEEGGKGPTAIMTLLF